MIYNFFVLTAEQRVIAMSFNGSDVAVDPRAIDNASPGVGINLNDSAVDFEPGDVVTLVGKYVATKRIVDDPQYAIYAPGMITYLLTLPWCTLETETIFAPPPILP
ncbi:hypothetical protein [Ancylobacter polymorphus]|uniref:Hedgehog/Intein (Hint) domain-containing protein n=1 Tax=Ancylobacter polymorphus TaxID=223390 RepID=A0ABU0BJA7_9HYPH|nr:hypothetical protein [Ancylobacter polymorphus]MDQ0305348.1 hypothetical protein [Ancylobacter polymorphus]